MTTGSHERDTSVSRIIKAPRRTIYQAFLDPEALVSWLPPKGMKGHVYAFDAREGGAYRLSLTYEGSNHPAPGKTSEHADIVRGRFVKLIPDERIVQRVEFESEDPAFAGAMTIDWSLADVPGGTEVTVRCENAPEGIRPDDHETGMRSSLENLAAFTE
jgi:uncharacterized protein YndB with AHSA1/START domain